MADMQMAVHWLSEYGNVGCFTRFASHSFQAGRILMESYGGRFTDCSDTCLAVYPTPLGTRLTGNINQRMIWFWADYPAEFKR